MKIELNDEELDIVEGILQKIMSRYYVKLEDVLEDIPFSKFSDLRAKLWTREWCESSGIRYEDMTKDDWFNFIQWSAEKKDNEKMEKEEDEKISSYYSYRKEENQ